MNAGYRFVCRECDAAVAVDAAVREGILADGCPLCDAPAVAADFAELDAEDIASEDPAATLLDSEQSNSRE